MSSTGRRKNQTNDRTFPYTGPQNTAGSIFQRQKVGKNSDSRSTSSNISMDSGLQISNQSLMPLMMNLKEENEHFGKSKEDADRQLKALDTLTKNLLAQNQALRLHYHQRSSDLQQLITTFSLNSTQNISECRHLLHLYRQHNCLLTKQIGELGQQSAQLGEVVGRVGAELERLGLGNLGLEEGLRDRKVKSKMAEKGVRKLEGRRQQVRVGQLEKQVCDLRLDINNLRRTNIATLNIIKTEKCKLSSQKPQLKTQAIQAIKSAKMLKEELSRIQYDYGKYCQDKETAMQREEEVGERVKELEGIFYEKKRKIEMLGARRQAVDEHSRQIVVSNQAVLVEKSKKQKEKLALEQQLAMKKKALLNLSLCHQQKKSQVSQSHSSKLASLHKQMCQQSSQFHKTLTFSLNPEQQQMDATIVNLKNQLQTYEREAQDMRVKIGGISNPVREIIRMEMMLKRMRGRG